MQVDSADLYHIELASRLAAASPQSDKRITHLSKPALVRVWYLYLCLLCLPTLPTNHITHHGHGHGSIYSTNTHSSPRFDVSDGRCTPYDESWKLEPSNAELQLPDNRSPATGVSTRTPPSREAVSFVDHHLQTLGDDRPKCRARTYRTFRGCSASYPSDWRRTCIRYEQFAAAA